ncbi:MAG: PEP-CTERM sorting domain-containing protein [Rhodoferax sp.]|uniref:PEP-CTERM sorting domain-containing protein n=1 Tax=Rhodoferax sp. TaxID=50421 RepID=UPI002628DB8E|nr:PEP-CTERM sorting domain-containing protein [Rhodoferax sp.]MDD2882915.1 PEP-CTERM sorting domain-containing protein [Rhodoferax sp.]
MIVLSACQRGIRNAVMCSWLVFAFSVAQAGAISTTFVSDNSKRGNMFDIHVTNALTINSFEVNLATGLSKDIFVYYKAGTRVGFETNSGAWTLLGSDSVTSSGSDIPTFVDLADLSLAIGDYALFVTTDGTTTSAIRYTNGTTTFSNADIAIDAGVGTAVPFDGNINPDRIWNGTINYTLDGNVVPEPGTLALFGAALAGLSVLRRRRS